MYLQSTIIFDISLQNLSIIYQHPWKFTTVRQDNRSFKITELKSTVVFNAVNTMIAYHRESDNKKDYLNNPRTIRDN